MIKCAYKNILEAAVVSLAAGTEDSSYPLYRLYDRGIGRIFKPTAAETIDILINANKANNPGLETGDFTGWDQNSSVIESIEVHSGSYSARTSPTGSTVDTARTLSKAVDPTKVHAVSLWHRIANWVSGSAETACHCYDASYGYLSGPVIEVLSADTAWVKASKTIGPAGSGADLEFPAGTAYVRIGGTCYSTPDLDYYIDDVAIYEVEDGTADRLLIPAGHNLAGMTLDILHSDDNDTFTAAVSQWAQPDSALVNKSWTSIHHPYWKFKITSPSSIPQLAELFLTSTYEWELNPKNPLGPLDPLFNVENDITAGGQDRFLVRGSPKRQRRYRVEVAGETQRQNVSALNDAWGGSKPFWLEDLDGDWIYGKLRSPLNLVRIAYQIYNFDFDFLEVLP